MPAFFIPFADGPEQAETVWRSVHEHLSNELGKLTGRRIYSVAFEHNGKPMKAAVGEVFPGIGQPVIAIMESAVSSVFFICTADRGVLTGAPWYAGKGVSHATDFDPAA